MCGKIAVSVYFTRPLTSAFFCLAAKGGNIAMNDRVKSRIIFYLLAGLIAVSGCGSSLTPENSRPEDKPKARIDFQSSSTAYDLGRDEQRGGHTLARHVARTDDELGERLAQERNISAASTWTDRTTAEAVVGEALGAQHGRVESWMRRGYPRSNLALHYNAGRVIGRSLRRGEVQAVECSGALIVLRANGPESFYVLTTYPEARE